MEPTKSTLALHRRTVAEYKPRTFPNTKKCHRCREVQVPGCKKVCNECRKAEPELCIHCKRERPRDGLMSCEGCALHKTKKSKETYSKPERKAKLAQSARQASAKARENGLCHDCKVRPFRPGKTCCETCTSKRAQRDKKRRHGQPTSSSQVTDCQQRLYHSRKSQGLCPKCGDKPSDGRVCCDKCRRREAKNSRKPETRAKQYLNARRRYAEVLEKGMCRVCRSRPQRAGKRLCDLCAPKMARREAIRTASRRQQEAEALSKGMCRLCKQRPIWAGEKTCEPCTLDQAPRRAEASARRRRQYAEAISNGLCGLCRSRPSRIGLVTCDFCGSASARSRQARQQAEPRDPTASSPDDGDEPDQDETMADASEDDSDWEDRDEAMEKTQVSNGQELLDTSLEDVDCMAIDYIVS